MQFLVKNHPVAHYRCRTNISSLILFKPDRNILLFNIAQQHGVEMHVYADDTQLYLPFKPEEYNTATSKMQDCLASIRSWMSQNQLKLNVKKFMIIGKPNSLKDLLV